VSFNFLAFALFLPNLANFAKIKLAVGNFEKLRFFFIYIFIFTCISLTCVQPVLYIFVFPADSLICTLRPFHNEKENYKNKHFALPLAAAYSTAKIININVHFSPYFGFCFLFCVASCLFLLGRHFAGG